LCRRFRLDRVRGFFTIIDYWTLFAQLDAYPPVDVFVSVGKFCAEGVSRRAISVVLRDFSEKTPKQKS
jgi:hypothetical protein